MGVLSLFVKLLFIYLHQLLTALPLTNHITSHYNIDMLIIKKISLGISSRPIPSLAQPAPRQRDN